MMSVEKLDSRIIKYRLYDEISSGVLYYTLDLDKYSLSIDGETTAGYKWVETPKSESFIKLMLRCDKFYLMNKLFSEVFDLEQSIEATKQWIEENKWFYRLKGKKKCFKEMDEICADCESQFVERVVELLGEYDIELDGDDEYYLWADCVKKDYKYWQKKAVDLFCEFIKPELKKELQE
jgi:hypothetical protein